MNMNVYRTERKKERKKNCADISLFSVDVNMGKGAFIILLPNTSE